MTYENIPHRPKQSKGLEAFRKDLASAHKIELMLKKKLEDQFGVTVETSQDLGSFSGWDLKVHLDDDFLTIEVKEDSRVYETGNVAVELYRIVNGKIRNTCLTATEADAYAYFMYGCFYLIKTEKLKELVNSKQYLRIAAGGDGNRARIAIFPKHIIFNAATFAIPA